MPDAGERMPKADAPPDPPAGRPTMRDVASAANVSVKTVSRVIHDYPFISSDVRTRVQAEVARLGFRPNGNAASLRRSDRSVAAVGVLIGNLADPFYAAMASGIEQVTSGRGFSMLVASSREDIEREHALLSAFLARHLDGLIVVSNEGRHEHLRRDLDRGTRIVFADRPPRRLPVDCVMVAHARGAQDAVAHLIAHGHRNIAYVGHDASIYTAGERERGYLAAHAQAGIEPRATRIRTDAGDVEQTRRATAGLLAVDRPPTAIFADNPRLTGGVAQAIAESRVPDTALVVFDDSELAELLGVTVVAQDAYELGRRAASMLFDRVDGDNAKPRRVLLPTTLRRRGSGEGSGIALRGGIGRRD